MQSPLPKAPPVAARKPVVVKTGGTSVKIYASESRGRPRFVLAYHLAGKRVLRTFGDMKDARREAEITAARLESGQRATMELRDADRESYVAALRTLEPFGLPLHAAVAEYAAARELLGDASLLAAAREYAARHQHAPPPRPVGEIVEEMLAAKREDGLSVRHLQTLRSHLRRFALAFSGPIGAVGSADMEGWLRGLGGAGRTRNNVRISVVTLFNFSKARGYLPKGMTTEAESVARARDKGGAIGILSPEELAGLLRAADGAGNAEAARYLALGAFTGLRTAELLRLRWDDINAARGHVTVRAENAKTATRRLVTIGPALAAWLARYPAPTGAAASGKVFSGVHAATRTIAFAKEHNGGAWPANCLRHGFASYRLAHVKDAARVALEMGNSPQMLFANYRELVTEAEAATWFAIMPGQAANVVMMDGRAA